MLTKIDLQAIDNIIVKRVDQIVTKRIRQELKPVKEDITKIRKDINLIVSFFDREYVGLRKRVEHIEERLKIPFASV